VNILTNAAKYTPEGGRAQVFTFAEGNDAVVRVVDNGMGISREQLEHVFDLFAQGERSLDRSAGGLGIGLTLARRIVEMHGGSIAARSAGLGKGSEFEVRLPLLR
jgi:signal transduction histidine kinase